MTVHLNPYIVISYCKDIVHVKPLHFFFLHALSFTVFSLGAVLTRADSLKSTHGPRQIDSSYGTLGTPLLK